MTKMFVGVPAANLATACGHLQGVHGELHQELGLILAGRVASVRGHIEHCQAFPSKFVERHREVSAELLRRGGSHTRGHAGAYVTFEAAVLEARRQHPALFEAEPTAHDRHRSRVRLYERCDDCTQRAAAVAAGEVVA